MKMTGVSMAMIAPIGRATNNDHRSEALAARLFGVISPKITTRRVMATVATSTLDAPPPSRLMAKAVPTEEARMMKAFSVSRMVAKNFSCFSTTWRTALAAWLPCSTRCCMRILLTDMRLASELLKKATTSRLKTRMMS